MNKIILSALLGLTTITATAQSPVATGGFQDPNYQYQKNESSSRGGFINTQHSTSKVSDSNQWQDDEYIVLEGNIIRQIGKDDFIFRDNTGETKVEIDKEAWQGQTISPTNKVRLYAEVDKSWQKIEVEVHRVEKIE